MAFATVEDLEARWRTLDPDEGERAATLLDDASAMLAALVGNVDESDDQQATLLRMVTCSMVMRSMMASESDAYGVSQMDFGMGPFSQAAHFANPNGDLYLTAQEKRLLGIGESYISGLSAAIDGHYGSNVVVADA